MLDQQSIESLFENGHPMSIYASTDDELVAVRDGAKGMAMTGFDSKEDPGYQRFIQSANECGLSVANRISKEPILGSESVSIFAFKPNEAWRVEALCVVTEALSKYGFSDSSAYIQSRILGYTTDQSEQWITSYRHFRSGWQGVPVYLLMTIPDRDEIRRHPRRCLVLPTPVDVTCVYPVSHNLRLRADASTLIPNELVLGRGSVSDGALRSIFKSVNTQNSLLIQKCNQEIIETLRQGLFSGIEFWTDTGWSS
jgi:hypothetical protein